MSISAYSKVFSQSAFFKAWSSIYSRSAPSSRNTEGIDGISLNKFANDLERNLRRLREIVRLKKFHFQLLQPFPAPKPNGKIRIIAVPTIQDRIVQRVLVDYLSTRYKDQFESKISFGFIKNRGVQHAAKKAVTYRNSKRWVFKTDITSFFDNISRELLKKIIIKAIPERSLHSILFEAIDCEVNESKRDIKKYLKELGIKKGYGLRQGMPLSPLFSNIFLKNFDDAIVNANYQAVRYADDLVFFGKNKEECLNISEFCKTELQKIGLEIPLLSDETKTIIYSPDEPAEFLGVQIARKTRGKGYILTLSSTQIERMRKELLSLASIPSLNSRGITLKNLGQSLKSRQAGFLAAYNVCSNIKEIVWNLDKIEQKILRTLYRDELGIKIDTLTAEARTFLGLQ